MLQLRDAQGHPIAIRRDDYAAPTFWIDTVDLTFDLDPAKTRVLNRMRMRRNPEVPAQPLRLDGDELNLARVLVDGRARRSASMPTNWCSTICPTCSRSRSSPPARLRKTPSSWACS